MVRSFYIYTFGCQMNVHDSGRIADILEGLGMIAVSADKDADLILFNTCTVRDHAHHKAISEIGRAVHMKKQRPSLIVGVCGCVAQEEKERLFELYPELNLVFGPDQLHRLPELLNSVMLHASCFMPRRAEAGGKKQEAGKMIATELIDCADEYDWLFETKSPLTPLFQRGEFDDFPPFIKVGHPRLTSHDSRATAFVTIMKGCNNNCSFCIVPAVRGREISKPAEMIIDEINKLTGQGVKEVTLLGQNVNSYRDGFGRFSQFSQFSRLIKKISKETNMLRIRYTSPHPKDLTDDLIEEHATNPKLCRHMHLPLQAGSNKILRAMKRSYNKERFLEKCAKLRASVPGIDITTDIIAGFPDESEADFCDTLEVVKEAAFDGMFAFKYSPRPGTKAAELKDDVPKEEKEERLQRLLELNAKIWKEKTERLIGTKQEVLVEGESKKQSLVVSRWLLGENQLTTNDQQPTTQLAGRTFFNKIVNFAGNLELIGHIVPVKIISAGANSLKGEIL